MRKHWKQWDFILFGSKTTADDDCSHEIKRPLLLGWKVMINLDGILKNQIRYFSDKGPYSQTYSFSSSHVWMWELGHKRLSTKIQTVVLEKTLESPLDSKVKPVNPKGNQPWIFIGRTEAENEASTCWPPDVRGHLIGKDSDTGKNGGQEEKGATEDGITDSMGMSLS